MKLSKTDWKYIVDTLMFLCMVGIVLIGLLMGFVIPEGRLGPGQSKFFLVLLSFLWVLPEIISFIREGPFYAGYRVLSSGLWSRVTLDSRSGRSGS